MNWIFGAGFFDNPWIVVAFFIGSALVNWISQQRQQRRRRENQIPRESSPETQPSAAEFDPEELVRRLFGERDQMESPPPLPKTPNELGPARPIRDGTALPTAKPAEVWLEGVYESIPPTPPVLSSPSRGRTRSDGPILEPVEPAEPEIVRVTYSTMHGIPKANVLDVRGNHAVPLGGRSNPWRDRRALRRAFVTSLLLAPPKGLEP